VIPLASETSGVVLALMKYRASIQTTCLSVVVEYELYLREIGNFSLLRNTIPTRSLAVSNQKQLIAPHRK
jgi:hypothetical protein